MERESIWSFNRRYRVLFEVLCSVLYVAGLVFRYLGPYEIQWDFETVKDLLSIGIFAATTAFFILKGVDFVFVLTEAFKKWQFERGIKKGQKERDELVMQWFELEKEKGPEGFQSPPPFLDNGHNQ